MRQAQKNIFLLLLFSHFIYVSCSTLCPGNQIAICNGLEGCRWNSVPLGNCVVDECIGLEKISCFDKDGCHNGPEGCTTIARSCWVRDEDNCTRLPLCRWDYGLSQCLERACECKFNPCYNLDVLPCTELNTVCTYTIDTCETQAELCDAYSGNGPNQGETQCEKYKYCAWKDGNCNKALCSDSLSEDTCDTNMCNYLGVCYDNPCRKIKISTECKLQKQCRFQTGECYFKHNLCSISLWRKNISICLNNPDCMVNSEFQQCKMKVCLLYSNADQCIADKDCIYDFNYTDSNRNCQLHYCIGTNDKNTCELNPHCIYIDGEGYLNCKVRAKVCAELNENKELCNSNKHCQWNPDVNESNIHKCKVIQCSEHQGVIACESDQACYYNEADNKCITNPCMWLDFGGTDYSCEANPKCELNQNPLLCKLKTPCRKLKDEQVCLSRDDCIFKERCRDDYDNEEDDELKNDINEENDVEEQDSQEIDQKSYSIPVINVGLISLILIIS